MSVKRNVIYTKGYAVFDPTLIKKVNNIVYQHFNQSDHSIGYTCTSHSHETVLLPLSKLHTLHTSYLENPNSNGCSNRLGYCHHRFFKSAGIKKDEIDERSFLKLRCDNTGLEISFITNQSNLKFLPTLKATLFLYIISYAYSTHVATKLLKTTITWCMISTLTTSSLILLIAPVQVPYSSIIRLATL
jgi:hypothetical protein